MSLPIRFSPESEETFETLVSQLSEQWGEAYVAKLKAKVSRALKAIAKSPYLYALADEQREIRKCVLHGNCSMFYKVGDTYIMVLYFWDNRQDPLL
ncbi:type II toxin-antitoxin system RelE/ParE family toxin [Pedobacter sp. GR22-6]|uniref:type II toxin-antitoxin system RelE/ParE family toxin n=1 Tax=Pedobacter sp. GR22-6 TaxID=3127957 RepID=UPI00307E472E